MSLIHAQSMGVAADHDQIPSQAAFDEAATAVRDRASARVCRKAQRVLLVGNYAADRQQSMQRYGSLLQRCLAPSIAVFDVIAPQQYLSRHLNCSGELAKWIGHVEKFLIFPFRLAWRSRFYDVVHICDHGNAPYLLVLPRSRTLVTCHDCLAIEAARGRYPGVRVRWTGRLAQRLILAGLRRAAHIACVSEATRRDLARLTGRSAATINVIPNILSYPYRRMRPDKAVVHLRRLGLQQECHFFLHVGNNSWYKNRGGVLEIFAKLLRLPPFEGHLLVLAGKPLPDELSAWVVRNGLEGRVLVLEGISDKELCAIYSAADALLFPSLHEGFGWPIIEAQACGCLVVTSDREPMTTVAGRGAIFVDPLDPAAAAEAFERGWPDREHLIELGHGNVASQDPKGFVAAYLRMYDAIGRRREGERGQAAS